MIDILNPEVSDTDIKQIVSPKKIIYYVFKSYSTQRYMISQGKYFFKKTFNNNDNDNNNVFINIQHLKLFKLF